jgi:hypothetical protein
MKHMQEMKADEKKQLRTNAGWNKHEKANKKI